MKNFIGLTFYSVVPRSGCILWLKAIKTSDLLLFLKVTVFDTIPTLRKWNKTQKLFRIILLSTINELDRSFSYCCKKNKKTSSNHKLKKMHFLAWCLDEMAESIVLHNHIQDEWTNVICMEIIIFGKRNKTGYIFLFVLRCK